MSRINCCARSLTNIINILNVKMEKLIEYYFNMLDCDLNDDESIILHGILNK